MLVGEVAFISERSHAASSQLGDVTVFASPTERSIRGRREHAYRKILPCAVRRFSLHWREAPQAEIQTGFTLSWRAHEQDEIAVSRPLAFSMPVGQVTLVRMRTRGSGGKFGNMTVLGEAWCAVRLFPCERANLNCGACAFFAHRCLLSRRQQSGTLMALA